MRAQARLGEHLSGVMRRVQRLAVSLLAGVLITGCANDNPAENNDDGPTGPRAVASIALSAGDTTIETGMWLYITATVRDAGGDELYGRTVNWSSSSPGVAELEEEIGEDAVVLGMTPGSSTITAECEGKSAAVHVTVIPPPPVGSITLTPNEATVEICARLELVATVRDTAGNVLTGRTIDWSSSDTTVAYVDTMIHWSITHVEGLAQGSATISASAGGKSAVADIGVEALTAPGHTKWCARFGGEDFAYGSPAIAADGTIYTTYAWTLYAINPDGSIKWRHDTGSSIYASPAVGPDGTIYVGDSGGRLYAVNSGGSNVWDREITSYGIISSAAVAADGTVYVGTDEGSLVALSSGGTVQWEFWTSESVSSSPAVAADGTIYVGSGDARLYAVNPNGSKKWEYVTGGDVFSSPAIGADGTVYVGSYDGKLHAVNPDGSLKWTFDAGGPVGSSPAVGTDGAVYVGSDDGRLYAVNADGSRRWDYDAGMSVFSSPAIGSDGTLYIATNVLHAVYPDGTRKWELPGYFLVTSPAIGPDGTIYAGAYAKLFAVHSATGGLASSAWPKFRFDSRNSGNSGN